MFKLSQNAMAILITVVLVLFFVGCSTTPKPENVSKGSTSSTTKPSSSQGTLAKFEITEPQSGKEIDRNVITVKGVGAPPGSSIKVEVLTNEWYLQDGKYDIQADGSWTFSPCHLKGRGNFRLHHTIKASLMKGNEVTAFYTVDEIKAPEPIQ